MATKSDDASIRTKKILFVTNSESGQANMVLAMALEAITRPDVEVHIASFPALERRVKTLSAKLNFHPLDGNEMVEMLAARGLSEENLPHPPTTKGLEPYDRFVLVLTGWDGESHMRLYYSIKKLIEELNPDITVVDFFLNAGFDACYSLNRKFVISTPNAPIDVARERQPWLKGFWYYPWLGTGISFPVSWSDLPKNIMAAFGLMWKMATSPVISEFIKHRNAHGLPGGLPIETAPARAVHVICPGVREIEFPLVVPDNLGLYGPIVLDTAPIESSDPELNQWLGRGETVIMCMGTHFYYTESQVKAVLNGFLSAVDHDSNTQFLWKLQNKSEFENLIKDALKNPRDGERFKVVDWFEADPASIMMHPNVIAYVHHGGANSFYEAALTGLPQIILAQWYDLYDMAVRAEYRGIGIYGNRNVAPDIEAVEFGTAVARLVRPGKESEGFRVRAKAAAGACRNAGGKRAAVDKLMEIIEGEE